MERITDDDELYRRIFPYYVKPDGTISSAAYMTKSKKPDPECSVYLARLTTAEEVLRPGFGLPGQQVVVLAASIPLSIGLSVEHDPQPDAYAHCLIKGLTRASECDRLAEASRLIPS